MRQKGSTDLNMVSRQRHLMIILSEMKAENKPIKQEAVRKELLRTTGMNVSLDTIGRDLLAIQSQNTFVKDIAMYHYSRINQQSIQTYEMIKTEALNNYQRKWTNNKKVIRKDPDGTTIETTETEEIASSKGMFLRIALEAEKAIQETINGKACDVSVKLMGDAHLNIVKENEIMKAKLEKQATTS